MNAEADSRNVLRSASRTSVYLAGALPRGLALFLGGFSLLNLVGALRSARFDANLWWIDVRAFPPWVANGFLFLAALCLLAYAILPGMRLWRRFLTASLVGLLLIESITNALMFYYLLARGTLSAAIPVPFRCLFAWHLVAFY
jgi:hypothetical protein